MSGDYTRFTFDPNKRYSGVLLQQGRVQLDSDWNEGADIIRRRVRTLSLDSFGPVGVPYLSLPDSFLLGLIAGPPVDLSITPGRLYVDGLVAETFEEDGATYLNQPFHPDPPALPAGDAVAYLDIWDREVTHIEDPELLDVALGGADTTTRLQTVWQLRVDQVQAAECGVAVGEPPSAGRLTSVAIAPPAPDDPCILPPQGGYRGLENRLYRIEIHDGGAIGAARFKWSRDNASLVAAVTGIAGGGGQATLDVNRIGRDEVMRFRIGNWVEVLDDHRELMGETGDMALIVDIDEANRRILLDRPLPAPGARAFGANAAEIEARHTRLKRWDQTAATNAIDADGLIITAAGPVDIEDGIQVSFTADPVGGSMRVADHWVFAARTATASIEELNAAVPRGIEHHYVQLAAITGLGGPAPEIEDCRPPEATADCCCTVVVRPGESIQDAIDSLPPEGGCVCLKAGIHDIDETVFIGRGSVSLHGESPGAIVRSDQAAPMLIVGNTAGFPVVGVQVATIAFEAGRAQQPPQPIILVVGTLDCQFDDCQLRSANPDDFVGFQIVRSDRIRIEQCSIEAVRVGIWASGYCGRLEILRNRIVLAAAPGAATPIAGILIQNNPSPVRIESNTISGALTAIALNDNTTAGGQPRSLAHASIISGNHVEGPQLDANVPVDSRLNLVDVAGDICSVAANKIVCTHIACTGIRVTGDGCDVTANTLISTIQEADLSGPIAIQIGEIVGEQDVPVDGCVVTGNVVRGFMHGLVAVATSDLAASDNVMEAELGALHFAFILARVRKADIHDNRVRSAIAGVLSISGRHNRITNNSLTAAGAGISLVSEWGPAVAGNRIDACAFWGIAGFVVAARCDIVENRITSCGFGLTLGMGVAVAIVLGELHVESNEVMDTGLLAGANQSSDVAWGVYGDLVLEARIESNLVTYSNVLARDPDREDRALLLRGLFEFEVTDNLVIGFPVQIVSNKFIGTGRTALVELMQFDVSDNIFIRFERVSFDHNYCMHLSPAEVSDERATVVLVGRRAVVMGNHVKATTPRYFSFDFNNMRGPFIGNVTTGQNLQHVDFPVPENGFNMIA
jgi:hypothetical protein